jgi:hypothetical protein
MEQNTLLKIARLRTLAARKGHPFDVARFAQDRAFAESTLQQLMNADDEELVLLGLEVMQALGMVRVDHAAPVPPPAPARKKAAPEPDQRYVGRLR